MSSRVLAGGIPPEGEMLLQEYMDKFLPDATLDNLKAVGIKGKVKNTVPKLDVILAIIDESLYNICESEPACQSALSLSKVHKYVGINELETFLKQQFGLDTGLEEQKELFVPPDELEDNNEPLDLNPVEEEPYIEKTTDFGTNEEFVAPTEPEFIPNDSMPSFESMPTQKEEEPQVSSAEIEELNTKLSSLQATLASKDMIIRNLQLQLRESGANEDTSDLVERIRELEAELKKAQSEVANKDSRSFADLGKITWAEQIITQVDDLETQVKTLKSEKSALETHTKEIEQEKTTLLSQVQEKDSSIEKLKSDLSNKDNQLTSALTKVETLSAEKQRLVGENERIIEEKTQELDESKKTIETLTEDINSMQIKLDSSTAELQVLQENIDSLQSETEELHTVKQELLDTKQEISNLNQQLQEKSKECETLSSTIQSDKATLDNYTSVIEELKKTLAEKESALESKELELQTKEKELKSSVEDFDNLSKTVADKTDAITQIADDKEKLNSELVILNEEIKTLSETITTLQNDINEKEAEKTSLSAKINSLNDTITELQNTISELKQQLVDIETQYQEKLNTLTNEKNAEIEKLQQEIRNLRDNFTQANGDKEQVVNSMQSEIDTLKQKTTSTIEDLTAQLSAAKKELAVLKETKEQEFSTYKAEKIAELEEKDTTISQLQLSLSKLNQELDTKTTELEKVNESYKDVQEKLQQSNDKINLQTTSSEELNSANYELTHKLNEIETEKTKLTQDITNLSSQVSTLESEKATLSAEKANLEAELQNVRAENEKYLTKITTLESTVESLKSTMTDTDSINEDLTKARNDLLSEQRNVAQLRAELSTTKTQNEAKVQSLKADITKAQRETENKSFECKQLQITIDELNSKINDLETLIENTPNTTDVDIDGMQQELVSTRAKVVELQTQLAEKELVVDELSTGVFGQLADVALPNVAITTSLEVTIPQGMQVICIASASPESNSRLYQSLKDTCKMTNKRCLILDLTTNSNIDAYFNIPKIPSPLKWLVGTEPFTNFCSNTFYPNVKVISLALAYLNELYLLQVDWTKRLNDLKGFADVVVINVGCLNNIVSKVLFNTFCRKMPSYAYVKATPLNIRVSVLNLTGAAEAKKYAKVICLDYQSESKEIYATLASQYKAEIVPPNRAVPLF